MQRHNPKLPKVPTSNIVASFYSPTDRDLKLNVSRNGNSYSYNGTYWQGQNLSFAQCIDAIKAIRVDSARKDHIAIICRFDNTGFIDSKL